MADFSDYLEQLWGGTPPTDEQKQAAAQGGYVAKPTGGVANLFSSGGLFGLGAPDGTLDPSQQEALKNSTLMGIASGLLKAGGPQTQRVGLGQALGMGMEAGNKSSTDMLNNFYKQAALSAQAKQLQAATMKDNLSNATSVARYNMFAKLNGLPELSLNQNNKMVKDSGIIPSNSVPITDKPSINNSVGITHTGTPIPPLGAGIGISGGSEPSIFNNGVVGGNANVPQMAQITGKYDPADVSQETLQKVYMGGIPGSPQQHAALANMLSFAGDKENSDYHRKLAYEGVNGFRPDPTNWNGPQTPLGEKSPAYIGQSSMAKNMPEQYSRAFYSYPQSAGENAGRWLGPNPVGLDTKLAGGGSLPTIPLPGQFYQGPAPVAPQGAPVAPMGGNPSPTGAPVARPSMPAIPAAPVGTPPPAPAQGGPGVNTGLPSAGGINPGPFTNPSGGAAKAALETLGKQDAESVAKAQQSVLEAKKDMGTIQAIQDFMPKVSTGWSAETRLEGARILSDLGVPKDTIEKSIMGIDPASGQLLQKNFLQLSSAAVRGMGAREPGSVISLFGRAYPNVGTDPEAITLQTNALKMEHQRQAAQANGMQNYLYGSIADAQSGKGYKGLNGYTGEEATPYLRAAEAISAPQTPSLAGQIQKNLSSSDFNKVYPLIPAGARYMAPDGKIKVKAGAN